MCKPYTFWFMCFLNKYNAKDTIWNLHKFFSLSANFFKKKKKKLLVEERESFKLEIKFKIGEKLGLC